MPTILVIDDEPTVRNLLYDILVDEGYHVVRASDGVEGLVCLRTVVVDLILCDIMMPHMDGNAFAARLRAEARYDHLPLVMMSAAANKNILPTEMYTAFLEKPFTIPALLDLLDRIAADSAATGFLPLGGDNLPTTPAA
jgi:CheY-like chemotaxis protein